MFALNLLSIAIYVCVGIFLLRPVLNPFAARALIVILSIQVVLFALHFIYQTPYRPETYQEWIFNIDAEGNLPNNVSSMLFFTIALTSLLLALLQRPFSWQETPYWLILTVLYAYLAFDEYASFHSDLAEFDWKTVYSRLGYVIVLGTVYFAWQHKGRKRTLFALLVIFLGMMASGGIFLDNRSVQLNFIEEMLELGGLTFFLVTMMTLAGERIRPSMWLLVRIVLVAANVAIALTMFTNMWIRPVVAYRLWATDINDIVFGDDMFVLTGYTSPQRVVQPGDTARFTLYWYANYDPKSSYRLSAHLVSVPQIESLAQVDLAEIGVRTPKYWRPGLIVRRPLRIDIPENIGNVTCLGLTLRLWSGEVAQDEWRDTTTGLLAQANSEHRVNEDTIILPGVVVIPDTTVPLSGTAVDYTFANTVTLIRHDIPQEISADEPLHLAFEWRVEDDISESWIQILHLFDEDGNVHIFDRVPFDEQCPTHYWAKGMKAVDSFTLDLPEDLSPGNYRLVSGFYHVDTSERISVTDANGEEIPDGIFKLGEITIVIKTS